MIQKFVGNEEGDQRLRLDSLLVSLKEPCFIKMDIDGGEVEVLRGSARLLEFDDVRWLIETHSVELEAECIRILQEAGYVTKIIRNAWWRFFIPEQRPIPHNRWLIAHKSKIGKANQNVAKK